MIKTTRFLLLFILFCGLHASAEVILKKQGASTQLLVNGTPMLVMGGELSNSAATSISDIDEVIPRMAKTGVNTLFIPAQWDLIEPLEGETDFSLIDEAISKARENHLKIIFLWFGAWKNSMSCYTPLWFKQDTKRFPRAQTENGKPLEIASTFSDNVLQADKKIFCQLMQHIKDIDSKENTVIMVQVENEIGMLESARDHCPLAEKAFGSNEWRKHISSIPSGQDLNQDEIFQAYYHALYVEQLAQAGKAVYNIPMFVNAALNSRGRKPGQYPSAGPLAHLIPIWKSAAPHIDIYAPDIYDTGFKDWVALYKRADNPFFTPETRMSENSGIRALYSFGEVDALGFSVFAIDQATQLQIESIKNGYKLINQLSPYLTNTVKSCKVEKKWGLLFDQQDKERIIEDKNTVMVCRHNFTLPWDSRATDGSPWPEGGGIIIKLHDDEYIIAGNGIVVSFQTQAERKQSEDAKRGEDGFIINGENTTKNEIRQDQSEKDKFHGHRLGIGFIDEIDITQDGKMNYIRRENGDQDHQGRHARISVGDYKILHVKLYEY